MDDQDLIELLRQFSECLEHPDPSRNPLATIESLGKQAVPRLIGVLDHEEPQIRRMAICALGCLHCPDSDMFGLASATAHLESLVSDDPDSLVRLYAAEALWMIRGDEGAIEVFVGGLQENEAEARRYAARMLGVVGPEAKQSLQALIDALDDGDVLVRRCAAEDLAAFGPAAAKALPKLEQLLDEDEWTRIVAAEAIARIDPVRAEKLCRVLVRGLQSGSPRIRHCATQALAELPQSGSLAVAALVDALDDEEELVRTEAIWALEQLGPAAAPAVDSLIAILQGHGMDGDDMLVRGMAASALAAIGPDAQHAGPDLLECLDEGADDHLTTRFRLQVARAAWRILQESRFLLSIGNEALQDDDWRVRRFAAQVLGELGSAGQAVVPDLQRASKDRHPAVRRQAASSLESISARHQFSPSNSK